MPQRLKQLVLSSILVFILTLSPFSAIVESQEEGRTMLKNGYQSYVEHVLDQDGIRIITKNSHSVKSIELQEPRLSKATTEPTVAGYDKDGSEIYIKSISYKLERAYHTHPAWHNAGAVIGELSIIEVEVVNEKLFPADVTVYCNITDYFSEQTFSDAKEGQLFAGQTMIFEFNWTPEFESYYTINARVESYTEQDEESLEGIWAVNWLDDCEYDDEWEEEPSGNDWEIVKVESDPDVNGHTAPNAWHCGEYYTEQESTTMSIISKELDLSDFRVYENDFSDNKKDSEEHIWFSHLLYGKIVQNDSLAIYYSVNNDTWTLLASFNGEFIGGWYHWYTDINGNGVYDEGDEPAISLDELAGKRVKFKFVYTMNSEVSDLGIYLDDFILYGIRGKGFDYDVGIKDLSVENRNSFSNIEREIRADIKNYGNENLSNITVECNVLYNSETVFSESMSISFLGSDETETLIWRYTPVNEGEYLISIAVLSNDQRETNNIRTISDWAGRGVDILILSDDDASAEGFRRILNETEFVVELRPSANYPPVLSPDAYKCVILASGSDPYPVADMSEGLRDALIQYHNNGGRLLLEGGELIYKTAYRWLLGDEGWGEFCWSVAHLDAVAKVLSGEMYSDTLLKDGEHEISTNLSDIYFEGRSWQMLLPSTESKGVYKWLNAPETSVIVPEVQLKIEHGVTAYADDEKKVVTFGFSIGGLYDRDKLVLNTVTWLVYDSYLALKFLSPAEAETLSGVCDIEVLASPLAEWEEISEVEIGINGSWYEAELRELYVWGYEWDSMVVDDGSYLIEARALDYKGEWSDTISVNVTVDNEHAPLLTKKLPDVYLDEDSEITAFNLNDYFTDKDGDKLSFDAEGNKNIIVYIEENGSVMFSAEENWNGAEMISFKASDGRSEVSSNVIKVEVRAVNDAPEISITYPEDGMCVWGTFYVKGTASDVDGDDIERIEIGIDSSFQIEASGIGTWSALLNSSELSDGEHLIYARAFDGKAFSNIYSLRITVNHSGMYKPLPDLSFDEDSMLENALDLSKYFIEMQGIEYTYSGNVHVKMSIYNGILNLSADENWNGIEEIRITATNAFGECVSDSILVTVRSVNDIPSIIINTPKDSDVCSESLHIEGNAYDVESIESVKVRIDYGEWIPANTTNNWLNWSAWLDLTNLSEGAHALEARVYDGFVNVSKIITFIVNNSRLTDLAVEIAVLNEPVSNVPTNMKITVQNFGIKVASADLMLYDSLNVTLLFSKRIEVAPKSSVSVYLNYTFKEGRHEITVLLRDIEPFDLNASNNIAVKEIYVEKGKVPPLINFKSVATVSGIIFGFIALFFVAGTETGRYGIFKFLLLPLFTRTRKDEALDHFTRGQIYEYIKSNPGVHYSQIMHRFELKNGTLSHHLNILEKQEYIKSQMDGMYRRFYPTGMKIKAKDINFLSEIQRNILNVIRKKEGISQSKIARELGRSRRIINYHVNLLADAGIIRVERHGIITKCSLEKDV